jgi:hypothetical protein
MRHRSILFGLVSDYPSKRRFGILLLLVSLAETAPSPAAPLITVGTGG